MIYNKFEIGNRIRLERERLNMSQQLLGDRLTDLSGDESLKQVSRTVVYRWESGTQIPSLKQFKALCKIFDCEMGYLLCEEGYENKTRTATDIHKATGLSEEAVNTILKMKRGADLNKGNSLPSRDEMKVHFLEYFITNGDNVLENMYQLFARPAILRTNEELSYSSTLIPEETPDTIKRASSSALEIFWHLTGEAYKESVGHADRLSAYKVILSKKIYRAIAVRLFVGCKDRGKIKFKNTVRKPRKFIHGKLPGCALVSRRISERQEPLERLADHIVGELEPLFWTFTENTDTLTFNVYNSFLDVVKAFMQDESAQAELEAVKKGL